MSQHVDGLQKVTLWRDLLIHKLDHGGGSPPTLRYSSLTSSQRLPGVLPAGFSRSMHDGARMTVGSSGC